MSRLGEGSPPVASFAGPVLQRWSDLVAALHRDVGEPLLDTARAAVESVLRPAAAPSTAGSAASTFGQQMVADVASMTDQQRQAGLAELGASAVDYAYALWALDAGTRARAAFTQLRAETVLTDPFVAMTAGYEPDGALAHVQDQFMREVAKLAAVDSVTAEVLRLRGASAHACRLCQSARNLSAIKQAGGVEYFDAIDPDGDNTLSDRHRTATRLADAFIWQPMSWPDGLAAAVGAHFSDTEAAEMVFDLMRNSSNKIAVAFAADAPHVDGGVEFNDIDPETGDLTWGLAYN